MIVFKNIIKLVVSCLVFLVACKSNTSSLSYKISEEKVLVKDQKNKYPTFDIDLFIQTKEPIELLLQNYYWKGFETIDTLHYEVTDELISYSLEHYTNGLYRITLLDEQALPLYFIVNGKKDSAITIVSSLEAIYNGKGKVEPNVEIECLNDIKTAFDLNQKQIEELKIRLHSISQITPKYYTIKDSLRKELELEKLSFYDKLENLNNKCASTFVENVLINSLVKPNRYKNVDALKDFETEPSFLHLNFFNNMKLNSEDYLGHPILFQSINEYLENYSGEFEEEYKSSIDVIFSNINNVVIQEKVNEFLIRYYLDKDLEGLANYIASNYLIGCSDNYIDDLKASERYQAAPKIKEIAADFTLPDANQSLRDLQSIYSRNKVTILYFWKSSCTICQEDHDYYINLQSQYTNKGIQILGVSIDKEKTEFLNTTKEHNFNYPNLCNFKGAWSTEIKPYKVLKTPSVYILDNNGRILMKNLPPNKIEEFLKHYLK